MAILLDDLAVRQYKDPVRMPDPGQTVRDEEHAAAHDGREARTQPRWPVTRSASSEGPESSDSVLTPISSSRRRLRASPRRSSVSGGGRLGVLTRSTMPEYGEECQWSYHGWDEPFVPAIALSPT